MTNPVYYIQKDPQYDRTLISTLTSMMEAWFSQGGSGDVLVDSLKFSAKLNLGTQILVETLDVVDLESV